MLIRNMNTTGKLAVGIGLAGSALLAAYLFTGNRKKKTQGFISKTGKKLKEALESNKRTQVENHDLDYI